MASIHTTGINTKKINTMEQAIEDWARAIDAANISLASKSVANAMKGSKQQAQIKSLCQSCNAYTKTLTTTLRKYEAKLEEAKEEVVKSDVLPARTSIKK